MIPASWYGIIIPNFKRAVGAASVLNYAFAILKERRGDTGLYDRLKQAIQNTIKNDTVHAPGSSFDHSFFERVQNYLLPAVAGQTLGKEGNFW